MATGYSRWFAVTTILSCVSVYHTCGFSSGANTKVCNTQEMKPEHTEAVGFISTGSNFTVEVVEDQYTPGGNALRVKITGRGQTFRGFLIQARKVDSFDRLAQGAMEGPPPLTAPICGKSGHGRTHTETFSKSANREISLSWHPPSPCDAADVGDVVFQATVVTGFTQPPHINLFSKVVKMKPTPAPDCYVFASATRHTSWSIYLVALATITSSLRLII